MNRNLAIGSRTHQTRGGVTHRYTIIGTAPHITQSGREVELYILEGCCAICREPFICTSTKSLNNYITRTCEEHRGQYQPRTKR